MKNLELIFYSWLSETKEERNKHNPFLEMFAEIHKSLSYVQPPKHFKALKDECEHEYFQNKH